MIVGEIIILPIKMMVRVFLLMTMWSMRDSKTRQTQGHLYVWPPIAKKQPIDSGCLGDVRGEKQIEVIEETYQTRMLPL